MRAVDLAGRSSRGRCLLGGTSRGESSLHDIAIQIVRVLRSGHYSPSMGKVRKLDLHTTTRRIRARAKHFWDSEPPWLVRDGLLGLVIGGLLLLSQVGIEDARAHRQDVSDAAVRRQSERLEDERAATAQRLENLRFVRERSSSKKVERPFRGLDLAGQEFVGLRLRNADFGAAKLSGATFEDADLRESGLYDADLRDVNFILTNLEYAQLQGSDLRGAKLDDAQLTGAVLAGSDLRGASLTATELDEAILVDRSDVGVCYDKHTRWPDGYEPPEAQCPADTGVRARQSDSK